MKETKDSPGDPLTAGEEVGAVEEMMIDASTRDVERGGQALIHCLEQGRKLLGYPCDDSGTSVDLSSAVFLVLAAVELVSMTTLRGLGLRTWGYMEGCPCSYEGQLVQVLAQEALPLGDL